MGVSDGLQNSVVGVRKVNRRRQRPGKAARIEQVAPCKGGCFFRGSNHLSAPQESNRAGDEEICADGDVEGRDGRGGTLGPRQDHVLPVGFEPKEGLCTHGKKHSGYCM